MEMEKSNNSRCRDRLSTLPDSVIFHIFWLMPMRDVVRTPLLSKRWNNLWTTSPYLSFKFCTEYVNPITTRNFVNRALLCWRGIKILKFEISFECSVHISLHDDIDLWLRFAVEKGVEELRVEFVYEERVFIDDDDYESDVEVEAYLVPQCLYTSCPSLKVLSLKCCSLQIKGIVVWKSLKVLCIDGYSLNQHSIDCIFSGSPQLESCTVTIMDNAESLSIRSSSLRRFYIEKYASNEGKAFVDTKLTISSPNLEILEIFGVPYTKCLLVDVSPLKLSHATLWMDGFFKLYGDGFIGDVFKHILPTIQYVQTFTLADWSLKVLGDMKKKDLLSPFPNVKMLRLNVGFEEFEQIVSLLEIFPMLKRLVLQDDVHAPSHNLLELNATNFSNSFLLQLRTVDVTWASEGNNIFPFLEILLKQASKLKKMVFRVKSKTPSSNSLLLASQKLLRMKRSSPNVELVSCEV